jgi:hypothetical protein
LVQVHAINKAGYTVTLNRRLWPKVGCSGPMAPDEKLPDLQWNMNMSGRTISRQARRIIRHYLNLLSYQPSFPTGRLSSNAWYLRHVGVSDVQDCILNPPGVQTSWNSFVANKTTGTVFVVNFRALSWDAFRCAVGPMLYSDK